MDMGKTDIIFESLTKRIQTFKILSKTLEKWKYLLPESWPPLTLVKNLEIQGITILNLQNDSNKLFKLFSFSLYSTDIYYNKIKFSLINLIQRHAVQISQILENFLKETKGIENYIIEINNGSFDFEITFILLCLLYNIKAEIYFQSLSETLEVPFELVNELTWIKSEENLMKFSISLCDTNIEKQHNFLMMDPIPSRQLEERKNLTDTMFTSFSRWSKVAFKNGATLILLKEGDFEFDFQELSLNKDVIILAKTIISELIESVFKDTNFSYRNWKVFSLKPSGKYNSRSFYTKLLN